jgi:hypothetical protein
MKCFYTLKSTWEIDFIKNTIFNNKFEFEDFQYNNIDYYTSNSELYDNCIVVYSTFYASSINNMSTIVKNIRPRILILLSDEFGMFPNLMELSKYTRLLLHNYNHSHYKYYENCIQLPLGYVSGFLNNVTNIRDCKTIAERKFNCSFIGEIKSDRKEMCDLFTSNMENTCISLLKNSWNLSNLKILPEDLYNIYSDSIFVINGRGNHTLDCFRIYEAIVSGAIPVIVATEKEINDTFCYNGYKPFFIHDVSWQKVLEQCLSILKNKQQLQTIQNINFRWWNLKIHFIQDKIMQCV